jgi:TM2 domain-containing membrane protein YozV
MTLLIIIGIIILIAFQVEKKNKKNHIIKSTGIAYLLWVIGVFGLLGLHRFYLGKFGTGFLWLFTGGCLGIGAFIDLFTLANQIEKNNLKVNPQVVNIDTIVNVNQNSTCQIKPQIASNIVNKDNSIIDVTPTSYRPDTNNDFEKNYLRVPYWPHQYIYSHSDINNATDVQKKCYLAFKHSFLKGEYPDLQGNTNYAFILLFDLLDEYDNHNDVSKLESQLKNLGLHYPKTKSYGISFLIKKMEKFSNLSDDLAEKIIDEEYYSGYYQRKLGSKYKSKLKLTQSEEDLFNNTSFSESKFSKIPVFTGEIFLMFYNLYNYYRIELSKNSISNETELKRIANIIARENLGFTDGQYDPRSAIYREILNSIWKFSENIIRKHYGISLKVSPFSSHYVSSSIDLLTESIFSKLNRYLNSYSYELLTLDTNTEIELNLIQNTRWKIRFEELTANYQENSAQFFDEILSLGTVNKNNPSVENIFFEASKFISKSDKEVALKLYVYYLHYDLKSATFDNKQLTKTIQKNLLKTNEQLQQFEFIISEFVKDKDLDKALESISSIYAIKRKKIQIDTALIKEVQEQHSETVEFLNEYLKDEYENDNNSVKIQKINDNEIELEINKKNEVPNNSIYLSEIPFTPIHISILDTFIKNNYTVPQSELERFAKSNGMFKNQLIENINEICYEILDDVLIEEEDDYNTINPQYYQRILAQC